MDALAAHFRGLFLQGGDIDKKHPIGASITGRQLNAAALRNQVLRGKHIREVPVQDKQIPQAILDAAKERGITIRDFEGTVYGN